jgi:hypothetical protein
MAGQLDVVVCEGGETGQELLDQALRVLDPGVIGMPIRLHRFDLSLDNRRRTANRVVALGRCGELAALEREAGQLAGRLEARRLLDRAEASSWRATT